MKKILVGILVGILSLVAVPSLALALETRNGDNVQLTNKDIFKGSLVVTGRSLAIDAKIDGDLFCAGQTIVITGEVTGDVLCAGQTIEIRGKVGGDARIMGQLITINGNVERNANLAAQNIVIGEKAVIGRELYTVASDVVVNGRVNRSWGAKAESLALNGYVAGDVDLESRTMTRGVNAKVMGKYQFKEIKEATPAAGRVNNKWGMPNKAFDGMKMAGKITSLVMSLVLGLIVVLLFPKWVNKNATVVSEQLKQSLLKGLLLWVLLPVVMLVLLVTIVGIPLALLLIPIATLMSVLAKIIVGVAVGRRIITDKKTALVWVWLIGELILTIIGWLPFVGGVLMALTVLAGTGAMKLAMVSAKK